MYQSKVRMMNLKWFKRKEKHIEPLVLEYFIVFQKSGLPIVSKCFGDFCSVLLVDEMLLSGFLSAITTMPSLFGKDLNRLTAVEMGYTKLLFEHTTPSGHTICLGFKNEGLILEGKLLIDDLFKKIANFVENTHKDKRWDFLTAHEIRKIENELIDSIIIPWIKIDPNYKEHGEKCSMSIESELFRGENDVGIKEPIWKRLSDVFAQRRKILKESLDEKREKLIKRGLLKKQNK